MIEIKTMFFSVKQIDGDYAYLERLDEVQDDLRCVARALLPAEINEGTKLKYEMLQYEIMQ